MATVATLDTGHNDMIHDAQVDFYGRRVATCSSDRTIRIYDLLAHASTTTAGAEGPALVAELAGHEGPVWQVAWSHPRFGALLASCGYDRTVAVHREMPNNSIGSSVTNAALSGMTPTGGAVVTSSSAGVSNPNATTTAASSPGAQSSWVRILSYDGHASSVNSVAWSPQELGLHLAAASSDGRISIITHHDDDAWSFDMLQDCPSGVNAITWAPAHHVGSSSSSNESSISAAVARIATAGCDGNVRVYAKKSASSANAAVPTPSASGSSSGSSSWSLEAVLKGGHSDWVRDVAWCPHAGSGVNNGSSGASGASNTLASCSDDGRVVIWRQHAEQAQQQDGSIVEKLGEWRPTALPVFPSPVWKLSWNATGSLLAVSCADNTVTVWREATAGGSAAVPSVWQQVSALQEDPSNAASTSAAAPFFPATPSMLPAPPSSASSAAPAAAPQNPLMAAAATPFPGAAPVGAAPYGAPVGAAPVAAMPAAGGGYYGQAQPQAAMPAAAPAMMAAAHGAPAGYGQQQQPQQQHYGAAPMQQQQQYGMQQPVAAPAAPGGAAGGGYGGYHQQQPHAVATATTQASYAPSQPAYGGYQPQQQQQQQPAPAYGGAYGGAPAPVAGGARPNPYGAPAAAPPSARPAAPPMYGAGVGGGRPYGY